MSSTIRSLRGYPHFRTSIPLAGVKILSSAYVLAQCCYPFLPIRSQLRPVGHPKGDPAGRPGALFAPTPKAAQRALEFFTAQINNDHTRKAYLNATHRFADWCNGRGIDQLARVQPVHVAAFIKHLQEEFSPPTVKQHLAALRMLFDWLVTGHVLDVNPDHAVRGPRYVVKKGKTADEARGLLDSIAVVRKATRADGAEKPALIGVMVYTFARVNAVLQMNVRDYFMQGRRGWVRLHEKGGKEHEVPCHNHLAQMLDDYIAAAGLKTRIGNHTFHATGITAYLKNSGKLEVAQHLANHESQRTTKLYDRRQDEISLDEVERIAI